jgi:hypothetical protein
MCLNTSRIVRPQGNLRSSGTVDTDRHSHRSRKSILELRTQCRTVHPLSFRVCMMLGRMLHLPEPAAVHRKSTSPFAEKKTAVQNPIHMTQWMLVFCHYTRQAPLLHSQNSCTLHPLSAFPHCIGWSTPTILQPPTRHREFRARTLCWSHRVSSCHHFGKQTQGFCDSRYSLHTFARLPVALTISILALLAGLP